MNSAVTPGRALPGTLVTVSPEAKPELVSPRKLMSFFKKKGFARLVRKAVPVADSKAMVGMVFQYDKWAEDREKSRSEVDRKLLREIESLNPRGRLATERRLRAIYSAGSEDVRTMASVFLYKWKSPRALVVGDEWIREPHDIQVFSHVIMRYSLEGLKAFDWFTTLAKRPDLTDAEVDILIDWFYGTLGHRGPRLQEGLDFIANYLTHPSGEVRWTAIFCLAYTKEYRNRFEELASDATLTRYGFVSGVAKQALRALDGLDHDLYDARLP
jgi:hypothetical protein